MPERGAELLEAVRAEHHRAHDEERPALADDLEGGGDAAVLVSVGALEGHR